MTMIGLQQLRRESVKVAPDGYIPNSVVRKGFLYRSGNKANPKEKWVLRKDLLYGAQAVSVGKATELQSSSQRTFYLNYDDDDDVGPLGKPKHHKHSNRGTSTTSSNSDDSSDRSQRDNVSVSKIGRREDKPTKSTRQAQSSDNVIDHENNSRMSDKLVNHLNGDLSDNGEDTPINNIMKTDRWQNGGSESEKIENNNVYKNETDLGCESNSKTYPIPNMSTVSLPQRRITSVNEKSPKEYINGKRNTENIGVKTKPNLSNKLKTKSQNSRRRSDSDYNILQTILSMSDDNTSNIAEIENSSQHSDYSSNQDQMSDVQSDECQDSHKVQGDNNVQVQQKVQDHHTVRVEGHDKVQGHQIVPGHQTLQSSLQSEAIVSVHAANGENLPGHELNQCLQNGHSHEKTQGQENLQGHRNGKGHRKDQGHVAAEQSSEVPERDGKHQDYRCNAVIGDIPRNSVGSYRVAIQTWSTRDMNKCHKCVRNRHLLPDNPLMYSMYRKREEMLNQQSRLVEVAD